MEAVPKAESRRFTNVAFFLKTNWLRITHTDTQSNLSKGRFATSHFSPANNNIVLGLFEWAVLLWPFTQLSAWAAWWDVKCVFSAFMLTSVHPDLGSFRMGCLSYCSCWSSAHGGGLYHRCRFLSSLALCVASVRHTSQAELNVAVTDAPFTQWVIHRTYTRGEGKYLWSECDHRSALWPFRRSAHNSDRPHFGINRGDDITFLLALNKCITVTTECND